MTINFDDPKWTAYVLGELDESERAAMETLFESSEEARTYVEELRSAANALQFELKPQVQESLAPEQRAAIQSAAEAGTTAGSGTGELRQFKSRTPVWIGGLAVAAMILLAVALPSLWRSPKDGISNEQPLSAVSLKTDESIAPSPAVASESDRKAAASTEIVGVGQSKESADRKEVLVNGTPLPDSASRAKAEVFGGVVGGRADPPAQNGVGFGTVAGAPNGTINGNTGDAPQNPPNNQDDLLAYLTQLAKLRGGNDGTTFSVDGFSAARAQQGQGQGQGQGQQDVGGGRGTGGGRGGAIAGGAGRGAAAAAPAAQAAPPPPPPAAMRSARENSAPTIDGFGVDNKSRYPAPTGNESYTAITDNPFIRVSQEPLSTFSSDVDTASYANMRRYLNQGQLPPRDAVRIEEMVNYFNYDYPQPSGRDPIGAQMEVASAPWNPSHRLVRIGIKARDIDTRRRPASNLVFLIDVSGSMQPQERLPLIKSGLKMLVNNLTENDHISMVVYAGASGVVLPSTSGDRKDLISRALDSLEAGGSTNGASGIQLAYQLATANFIPGGVNRVILATDGDFNVGLTNQNELVRLIQDRARGGVFLSVLGVGMGNLKDSTMERLADSGNGNYAYIDTLNEAHKVLVEQMGGTLITVAKDVKLQVEFNPGIVEAYRLIGYENRLLANQDFNDDRKDAGDMGAGHTVTALYEIVPRGGSVPGPDIDPLKYQPQAGPAARPTPQGRITSNETLTLKIRYKEPTGTESKLLSLPLVDREGQFSRASADFRFAAAVAEFGMILRGSPYRGNASVSDVLDTAQGSRGTDRNGYRQEFIGLVQRARAIR